MASPSHRNLVTNLYLIQQWWDSRVGRSILNAIRKWKKSTGKSERVSYVNNGSLFQCILDEKVSKELADTYDGLMKTLYQKKMVDFVGLGRSASLYADVGKDKVSADIRKLI
jgi:hypothetical protein